MPPVKRPVPAKAVAKPGAKKYEPIPGFIYEDDERPQARLQYNLDRWYNKDKARQEGPQERTFAPQRTKDDAFPPAPPSFERGLGDWYRTKAPPLFIQPMVGPAQDAKQATGMRHGFTDEAKDALRSSPVLQRPPREGDPGGGYWSDTGKIESYPQPGSELGEANTQNIAHEFGHKWWFERLSPDEQASYMGDHRSWREPGQAGNNTAAMAENSYQSGFDNGFYKNDTSSRPTETHARVVARAAELQQPGGGMPPYMQPYFRGLLKSVPNPRPWPSPNPMQRMGPDDSGNYG